MTLAAITVQSWRHVTPVVMTVVASRDTGGHDSRGSDGMVLGRRHCGGHSVGMVLGRRHCGGHSVGMVMGRRHCGGHSVGMVLGRRHCGGHSVGIVLGRGHCGHHSRKEQSLMRVLAPAMQNLRPLSALCSD